MISLKGFQLTPNYLLVVVAIDVGVDAAVDVVVDVGVVFVGVGVVVVAALLPV